MEQPIFSRVRKKLERLGCPTTLAHCLCEDSADVRVSSGLELQKMKCKLSQNADISESTLCNYRRGLPDSHLWDYLGGNPLVKDSAAEVCHTYLAQLKTC